MFDYQLKNEKMSDWKDVLCSRLFFSVQYKCYCIYWMKNQYCCQTWKNSNKKSSNALKDFHIVIQFNSFEGWLDFYWNCDWNIAITSNWNCKNFLKLLITSIYFVPRCDLYEKLFLLLFFTMKSSSSQFHINIINLMLLFSCQSRQSYEFRIL